MEDKNIHVFPKKEFKATPQDEWVEWTKGDLVVQCHNCGHITRIPNGKGLENGIQIPLPISNYHEILLSCEKCNSALSFHFVKAEDGEVVVNEEITTDAKSDVEDAKVIDIETKEEIKEDEPKEENTEA